jgi:metal-responsive CopG/Arc/MetJ family transcriptional regulator
MLKPYLVRIDPEELERLKAIKTRDGINESEQIRRAIREWLKRNETGRKRVVARKRP